MPGCYVLMACFGLSVPLFSVTTDAWLPRVIVPLGAGQVSRLRLAAETRG
jgi:hypothetical protein